jgi:hypothetical protein
MSSLGERFFFKFFFLSKKKTLLVVVVHAYGPSTQVAEAGGLTVGCHAIRPPPQKSKQIQEKAHSIYYMLQTWEGQTG